MRTGSIYIIKNTVNKNVYIGQTTMTVHERFMTHMKPSAMKVKRNYKLYNAINKYGRDKFYFEILEENIPLSQLNEKEIRYIAHYDSFNNGYNSTKGGDGRIINVIDNEEELLALAQKGVTATELSERFHVHTATILRTLHKLGFKYYDTDVEHLKKLVSQNKSNEEIAQCLGIHIHSVPRTLERYGLNKYNKKFSYRKDFDYESFKIDYYNQMPISEICHKYSLSKTTFYRVKTHLKLKNRPQIYKNKVRYY